MLAQISARKRAVALVAGAVCQHTGGRARRIAIVALARKLLVALWRYLERGVVPQGAHLKTRAAA